MTRWPASVLVLGALDVLVAAAVATFAMLTFGTRACNDTNPMVCSNYWGRAVPDGRTPATVLLATFLIVLAGLTVIQLILGWGRTKP